MPLRLVERVGRAVGFSAASRQVRVWTSGMPGEEDSEVVLGTIVSLHDDAATIRLDDGREVIAIPRERGWGFDALWFSFIAVDASEGGKPLGRWFLRLGR